MFGKSRGNRARCQAETIDLSRARLVAKVLPCYDSLQAAAAHGGSLSRIVK
jgi:hypothetical protein